MRKREEMRGMLCSHNCVNVQTHTGHWLSVNESFIPLCLPPHTDTLWSRLSFSACYLPAEHTVSSKMRYPAHSLYYEPRDCKSEKWRVQRSTEWNGLLTTQIIKDHFVFMDSRFSYCHERRPRANVLPFIHIKCLYVTLSDLAQKKSHTLFLNQPDSNIQWYKQCVKVFITKNLYEKTYFYSFQNFILQAIVKSLRSLRKVSLCTVVIWGYSLATLRNISNRLL